MKNFFLGIKKLALEQSRTYSSSREKSFSRITKKQKFSQKTKKDLAFVKAAFWSSVSRKRPCMGPWEKNTADVKIRVVEFYCPVSLAMWKPKDKIHLKRRKYIWEKDEKGKTFLTMDYQIRRELFESIASDITCYFCKIVPRKGMPNFRIDKKLGEIKKPFFRPRLLFGQGVHCVFIMSSRVWSMASWGFL